MSLPTLTGCISLQASAGGGDSGLANTHCADFGGGYLEAAAIADHEFLGHAAAGSISFSLWIKLSSTGDQTLISTFGGSDGYNLAIASVSASPELHISIWDQPISPSGSGFWYKTSGLQASSTPLETGKWQHIVAIFDDVRADPGTARIYVDGEDTNADVDGTYDRFTTITTSHTKFRLGSRGAGTAGIVFSGLMDEVSIWSKALTEGEVEAIFLAGVETTTADLTGESGLESWYRFKSSDDFTGTTGGIVDELGNSDLTASGTVSSASV